MNDSVQQPGLSSLSKSFEPAALEAHWGPEWEKRGYGVAGFRGTSAPSAEAAAAGRNFAIQLPPPNVTGTLHMGHAFNQTIMDSLTRYHRMMGFNTAWIPGTDHAGIATQIVVERQLQEQGISRHDMGPTPAEARKNFVAKVWEWKEQSGNTITSQMRRMGDSVDWSREYFTMDDRLSKVVTETFVQLYEQGLIYRGKRLVNWDPELKTAVSDLEVESEEEDGFLWHIAYPLADGSGERLVVATTRPETMLGDVAVMVHPEDERYRRFIGKSVTLPLVGRDIPVIADAYVDKDFGTGVVKVTPAHDANDYAVGQRHGLPMIGVLNLDATINDNAPAIFRGLNRFAARKAIVADLEAQGLLVETRKHKLMVPRCARTGQIIEPMLTDQWFVAMNKAPTLPAAHGARPGAGVATPPDARSIAQKAIDAVQSGQVRFVPEQWVNTYNQWMNNIQDWCISRQLWWGHQIPAWYDEEGNVYVARNEAEAQAQAPGKTLRRDEDVLDTWYSSALVPFSTLGWPEPTEDLNLYLPSSVLVTGHDIIFFWVARMIMMTTHFTGRVPFRDVYITGLVRDKDGQKMSKSKGNILDPLDIIDGISIDDLVAKRVHGLMQPKMAEKIEKATRKDYPNGINAHGADALRFTMAALAGPGRDIKFDLARAEGYKNFCNKLWNATRFALMNVDGFSLLPPGEHTPASPPSPTGRGVGGEGTPTDEPSSGAARHLLPEGEGNHPVTDAEKWILSQLDRVSAEAAEHFASYRFDLLAQCLYEFAWNQFCDWFVELAKPALQGDDTAAAQSTRHTLLQALDALLRLLHPLIPFVTEELWQSVAPKLGKSGSLMLQAYPQAGDLDVSGYASAEADIEWLKAIAGAVRRIRSELGVSPSKQVSLLLRAGNADDAARVARLQAQLRFLCRLERIESLTGEPPAAAPAVVGELQLFVPLEGLVDLDAERIRLDKEIAKVSAEKDKSEAKLAKFGAGVPAAVVEQERVRLVDWSSKLDALSAQRSRLG